ncbi:MAG: SpoIIE family protein phosphatase [Bryobacteraceae bacterium]
MLRRRGLDLLFLAALGVWIAGWAARSPVWAAVGSLAALALAGVLGVRLGRRLLRPLIWRLRNRLAVAYFFIAVIPIALFLLLSRQAAIFLGEQVAAHLVQVELEQHAEQLHGVARLLAQSGPVRVERPGAIAAALDARFPGIQTSIDDAYHDPVAGWGDASGVMVRDRRLYLWAHTVEGATCVTVQAPLTRRWLSALVPGLGPVSVLPGTENPDAFSLAAEQDDPPLALVPPVNWFDDELRWGTDIPVARWDTPGRSHSALLGVRTRFSPLIHVLTREGNQASLPNALWIYGILLAIAQAASIYIGVTVTRTITAAVDDLHEGTHHVSQGDFAWRIPEKGVDQVAGLSRAFNQMTGQVERLLEVAKESERLQAEVEIARKVQAQLFPQRVLPIPGLDLLGVCAPARMVSGDYYDYQEAGGRFAIAIGDVAGKGISAALLMSSLQAYFRMQLDDLAKGEVANAVARINRMLHATTPAEKFATLFLGVYDAGTGELIYSNAGHPPPLLLRNGAVRPLEVNGMVVGAFGFARYEQSRLVLEPGDVLVAFTDGVSEPENCYGEMFGEERIGELLKKSGDLSPEQFLEAVHEAVTDFTGSGELQDDLTLIVARRVAT